MPKRVLVLDSGYRPIAVVSWTKAMSWLVIGKAEVIEDSDEEIRSASKSWKLPSVIRKIAAVFKGHQDIVFSRQNLFFRDNYQCQYCGKSGSVRELTFDHVVPKSHGGGTNWLNIVAACYKCNVKKANRTPDQANMKLLRKPQKPKWTPLFIARLRESDPSSWNSYVLSKQPDDRIEACEESIKQA
jgi:5-methylcytosine-specific restriction endonuclease McrA